MIEIMVAFSILIVALLGIINSFPFGLSIGNEGERSTVASYLCQEKIEELISLGYENINIGNIETRHRLSVSPNDYFYDFEREANVSYVDGNLADSMVDLGLKKISSTVYYKNAISKKETSHNVTTLISTR